MSTYSNTLETNAERPPQVRITAPSTLDEGYTFDAVYNGEVFSVTVPPGGVKEGESFLVPFIPAIEAVAVEVVETERAPSPSSLESPLPSESTPILPPVQQRTTPDYTYDYRDPPIGAWKTSLFECLSEGFCHPSLCNAICFPQILMGQVLTRMKLTWCGRPSVGDAYKSTTCIWVIITFIMVIVRGRLDDCAMSDPKSSFDFFSFVETILNACDFGYRDDDVQNIRTDVQNIQTSFQQLKQHVEEAEANAEQEMDAQMNDTDNTNSGMDCSSNDFFQFIQFVWFWTTLIVLARIRRVIREAHGIRAVFCCEDLVCAFCCGCCTIAQLARQTADYSKQRAYWCTRTGLANDEADLEGQEYPHNGHRMVHAHPIPDDNVQHVYIT